MESRIKLAAYWSTRDVMLYAVLFIALIVSLAYSLQFLPFVIDDSLISYRYSERLLQGEGLTWNDGERVEGYSNLLWVILVACGGLLHSDMVVVGWALGLIANVFVLIALAWAFGRSRAGSILPTLTGLLVLAFSGSFALWGVGGLETPLLEALLAWALAIIYRRQAVSWTSIPALLLGAAAVTRPDGYLFSLGIAVALVIRNGFSRAALGQILWLLVVPAMFVLAATVFRYFYYGDLVPNTTYARLAFSLERLRVGGLYVVHGSILNSVVLAVVVAAVAALVRLRRWMVLRDALIFLVPAAAWLGYIGIIGGDRLPFFRHWMPAFVCFTFALVHLMRELIHAASTRYVLGLSIVLPIHFFLLLSAEWPPLPWKPDVPIHAYRNLIFSELSAGEFLRKAFGARRPLVAINSAGTVPYASKLPSLDMLGLTDAYIAHHRPSDFGRTTLIGHELGDGAYVLSRKPDLIAFCEPTLAVAQPCFRAEREMVCMQDFWKYYRLVYYRSEPVDMSFWTRVEDGRLGIVRNMDAIYIPGFLLATRPGVRAVLDRAGGLVAAVDNGDAIIDHVYVPAGIWDVSLLATPGLHLEVFLAHDQSALRLNQGAIIVSGGDDATFDVSGSAGKVYAVILKRLSRKLGGRVSDLPSGNATLNHLDERSAVLNSNSSIPCGR